MERYIKPSCEIVELADANNLLASVSAYDTPTSKPAYAPRRSSFDDSDFEEDEDL